MFATMQNWYTKRRFYFRGEFRTTSGNHEVVEMSEELSLDDQEFKQLLTLEVPKKWAGYVLKLGELSPASIKMYQRYKLPTLAKLTLYDMQLGAPCCRLLAIFLQYQELHTLYLNRISEHEENLTTLFLALGNSRNLFICHCPKLIECCTQAYLIARAMQKISSKVERLSWFFLSTGYNQFKYLMATVEKSSPLKRYNMLSLAENSGEVLLQMICRLAQFTVLEA